MTDRSIAALEPGLRVLVTAGAAGIGRTIADTLVDHGARIWVCDLDRAAMERCAAERPSYRVTACDVADRAQVDRLFGELEQGLGGLDVLVNNAGIAGPTGPIDEINPAEWERCITVNLNSMFYCARRAVPHLKAAQGVMVNLSSVAGRLGYALRTPYAASKWAVVGLTKSLAKELGPAGVRVNCIQPGVVEGPRIDRVIRARAEAMGVAYDATTEHYRKQAVLERMVTAQDIANTALFLCAALAAATSRGRRSASAAMSRRSEERRP
jgi:NAD(P)-dependent dehydrogenase (short-subunit alcohol dehydrogenase family)